MNHDTLSANLIIQYAFVGLILAGAVAWIVWKLISAKKKGNAGCCGCSMAQACSKAAIKRGSMKKRHAPSISQKDECNPGNCCRDND